MPAIEGYDGLVSAILDRMNDTSLEPFVPEFIQMAEAMFNRRLLTLDSEGVATIPAAASINLPTDYSGSVSMRIGDYAPLSQLSADDFQMKWNRSTAARPQNFCIRAGQILLGPSPDQAYTVTMTYLRRLVPLSASVQSNWLLDQNPDLYLYASLTHAEARGWNDERLPMLSNAADGIIAEINAYDARKRRGNYIDTVAASYF